MQQTAFAMSQDIEGGNGSRRGTCRKLGPVLTGFTPFIVNGNIDEPRSGPNQSYPGESSFRDSSGPLFSMYTKIAEEEDNKMTDRWQKDADGILIFVSFLITVRVASPTIWNTIDRFILCRRCCATCGDSP